jgi:hypothetical protein
MRAICQHCFHCNITYVEGRQRLGCMRARILPDGKTLRPPRDGWEAVVERLPQSKTGLAGKAGDQCGPEARHFKEG